MLRAVKLESDRLIDRDRHRLGCRVAVVAHVNCDGLSLHSLHRISTSAESADSSIHERNAGSSPSDRECSVVEGITLGPGMLMESAGSDFNIVRVSVRAANPAPKANRMTGPKLLAAATPIK